MIFIRSSKEVAKIRNSCKIVRDTLLMLEEHIEPGIQTIDLDRIAEEFIRSNGAIPGFKGLYGFPATLCVSVNEEVVHGIPSKRTLKDGDVIGIDCGVLQEGFYGDHAKTFAVGNVVPETMQLLNVTKDCLHRGIEQTRAGNRIGDISNAIQTHAESFRFGIVEELVGHGIGEKLHEEPQIPNFGPSGKGPKIQVGMCFAIEPMINLGSESVYTKSDGWTVCTADGKPSAHFEHTVTVTEDGPEILTI